LVEGITCVMQIKELTYAKNKRKMFIYILYNIIFPLVLLMFPLIKSGVGVDYTDSMYSPGNFVFFSEMEGTWVIATYLSNVIGFLITKLPGAGTYLGLRIYANLFVSAMALISYYWLKNRIKIPAWIVAAGEVIAIGLCWCPTTILYNYLTYFFMLLSLICLYEGLTREKNGLLVTAGIFLGANLMVRFPNVIEVGFILAVWIYGFLKFKKFGKVVTDTLWCVLGYFACALVLMGIIVVCYGVNAYVDMIMSLFSMTDTATSYKPVEMILALVYQYGRALKWPFGMAVYVIIAGIGFKILKGRLILAKKLATILGIIILFRWYYGQGMFNVDYHTYLSVEQWAASLLILAMCVFAAGFFGRKEDSDYKLLCVILLLVIAITPIGSNNNIYPSINNLFLVAPVAIYGLYKIIVKVKVYSCTHQWITDWIYPLRAMIGAIVVMILIQSIGFGTVFVFRGARDGEKRDTKIINNDILKGMYTNAEKAEAIGELTEYWNSSILTKAANAGTLKVLLAGDLPGVAYFLDAPCAIPHSWPDLESYSYATFERDMKELEVRITEKGEPKPIVIINYGVNAVITEDATAMDYYEKNRESGEEYLDVIMKSKKIAYLSGFLKDFEYEQTFSNKRFVVYE